MCGLQLADRVISPHSCRTLMVEKAKVAAGRPSPAGQNVSLSSAAQLRGLGSDFSTTPRHQKQPPGIGGGAGSGRNLGGLGIGQEKKGGGAGC